MTARSKYKVTFQIKKHLERMAAAGRTESTITNCRRVLGYLREYLRTRAVKDDIRKVDARLLSEYRRHVLSKEEWSMNYRIEMLHTVFNMFHDLTNDGILFINPASQVKLPGLSGRRLPVYLNRQEVEKLLEASRPDTPAGLRDRAILETLYSTGIRAAECCNLEVSAIDFEGGLVTIRQGKGRKDRLIPIGKTALHYVSRYMSEVRGPGECAILFRSMGKGEKLCGEALRAIVRRACRRAGIGKRVYPHLLRHSFAVHMLEGGAGIRHIAAMLGHEHLATTQVYTQVVPLQLKRVHEAAHPAAHTKDLPTDVKPKGLYHRGRQ